MALDQPPSDSDGAEYLTIPQGTELEVNLPSMCILVDRDEAIATAAALNTPYFPKLRRIILDGINQRIGRQWP